MPVKTARKMAIGTEFTPSTTIWSSSTGRQVGTSRTARDTRIVMRPTSSRNPAG